jgi:Tfp pilus assembly protein PilN
MRNIEASQWLSDPQLQVVETAKQGTAGSEFTLYATQKSATPAEDENRPQRKNRAAGSGS